VLLVGGQVVMRWWLTIVVRRKSEELFDLNLLLVTLGLAWLTEHAGLSLALGAFIAGMLIAETEFKHQVETDIRPFHDVLLGLFFITIGMKLDAHAVFLQWPLVPAADDPAGGLQVRAGHRAGPDLRRGARRRAPHRPSTSRRPASSASCCSPSRPSRSCCPPSLQSPILASMVLSMLATPVAHPLQQSHRDAPIGQRLADAVGRHDVDREALHQHRGPHHHRRLRPQRSEPGAAARCRANRLHRPRPRPGPVRQAAAAGQSVVFGDAARLQSLVAAGLARASAVVVTYHDTPSALKILQLVQMHAPKVPVVVRRSTTAISSACRRPARPRWCPRRSKAR
jgi:CPA2 family monovalent cation:H+ antiporter-2